MTKGLHRMAHVSQDGGLAAEDGHFPKRMWAALLAVLPNIEFTRVD